MNEVSQAVKDFGPIVAVLVALVGLAAAIEQITLGARLRRLEAWAAKAIEQESGEERLAGLRTIRRVAVARLVAATFVPGYHLVATCTWAAIPPALMVARVASDPEWTSGGSAALGSFVLSVIFFRQAIRVFLERQRIASDYVADRRVGPARLGIMDRMEGGTRREFRYAIAIAAGINALGLGVTLVVAGDQGLWAALLAIAGLVVAQRVIEDLQAHSVTTELRDNDAVIRRPGVNTGSK